MAANFFVVNTFFGLVRLKHRLQPRVARDFCFSAKNGKGSSAGEILPELNAFAGTI
jgi:hypothetical protein